MVFKLVEAGQINELGLGKGKNVRKLVYKSFYYKTFLLNISGIILFWYIWEGSVSGNSMFISSFCHSGSMSKLLKFQFCRHLNWSKTACYIYILGVLRKWMKSLRIYMNVIFIIFLYYRALYMRWASPVAQMVKNLPAVQETQVWSLGQEDPGRM